MYTVLSIGVLQFPTNHSWFPDTFPADSRLFYIFFRLVAGYNDVAQPNNRSALIEVFQFILLDWLNLHIRT